MYKDITMTNCPTKVVRKRMNSKIIHICVCVCVCVYKEYLWAMSKEIVKHITF